MTYFVYVFVSRFFKVSAVNRRLDKLNTNIIGFNMSEEFYLGIYFYVLQEYVTKHFVKGEAAIKI